MATNAKAAPKSPKQLKAEAAAQFDRFRQFAVDHGADEDSDAKARQIIAPPRRS